MKVEKLNELREIPTAHLFDGYVWLSDAKKPEVLIGKYFDFSSIGKNPFVIEALLYDAANEVSYHVRHSGRYHIHKYDLKHLPDEVETEEVSYLPHRLDGVKKCKFKQIWMPEKDPYCEDMPVLTMKALVFVGFEG
ncbi:MAG: hypothetical protein Kow0027_22800 [Saprospiraceae bacterium]